MVREGYIYVLVCIDGRNMYCQSASLDMSSLRFGFDYIIVTVKVTGSIPDSTQKVFLSRIA